MLDFIIIIGALALAAGVIVFRVRDCKKGGCCRGSCRQCRKHK